MQKSGLRQPGGRVFPGDPQYSWEQAGPQLSFVFLRSLQAPRNRRNAVDSSRLQRAGAERGARGPGPELEEEGGHTTPVPGLLPNPGGTVQNGLGGVGDLPKTSPLVTQPPVVAFVTLG